MKKYILLFICSLLLFVGSSVGFGDETTEADKTDTASATYTLKNHVGLPEGFEPQFFSTLVTATDKVYAEKPEQLKELPEALKNPLFFKIKLPGNEYFGALSHEDGKEYDKYFIDFDMNGKLDEKPVKAAASFYKPNLAQSLFELINVTVKDKKYGFFLRFYTRVTLNRKTNKNETFAMIYYGLINSFVTEVKIGESMRKLVVVDKKADNRVYFLNNMDSLFLDANGNGKFGWASGTSEVINGLVYIEGNFQYTFKIDIDEKKVVVTAEKVEFGKILFDLKGVENLTLSVASGMGNNSMLIKIPIKDGAGTIPVGKFAIKSVDFDKDGKHCQIVVRSYSIRDQIEITKDKPFDFKLNLHMKYNIADITESYKVEGKTTYRMQGFVCIRRTYVEKGKEVTVDTKTQLLVDGKEFGQPVFTVKDGKGNVIIENSEGKPFCWGGRSDYVFCVDETFAGTLVISYTWNCPPYQVALDPVEYTVQKDSTE